MSHSHCHQLQQQQAASLSTVFSGGNGSVPLLCKKKLLFAFVRVMRNLSMYDDVSIRGTLCHIILQRFMARVSVSSEIMAAVIQALNSDVRMLMEDGDAATNMSAAAFITPTKKDVSKMIGGCGGISMVKNVFECTEQTTISDFLSGDICHINSPSNHTVKDIYSNIMPGIIKEDKQKKRISGYDIAEMSESTANIDGSTIKQHVAFTRRKRMKPQ